MSVEAYNVQLFCKTKLRLYLKVIAVKFLDKTRSEWPNPKKGRNSIMHRLGKGNGLTSKTLGVHKNTVEQIDFIKRKQCGGLEKKPLTVGNSRRNEKKINQDWARSSAETVEWIRGAQ